jgi:signal transduction histidine kinase/CheY-like chemotaxis protein
MHFDDWPIKRKVMAIVLLTTFSVLIMTCGTLLTYEYITHKQNFASGVRMVGEMISDTVGPALLFNDDKTMREALATLRANPEVTAAAVYDEEDQVRAVFPTNLPFAAFPPTRVGEVMEFEKTHLTFFRPVFQHEMQVGTIFLQGDLQGMYRRLGVYLLVLGSLVACSILVTLFLSNIFQRRITEPLLSLARTARRVSEEKDYSQRAVKVSDDELGYLTEAFNSMLQQIESSHSALQKSEARLSAALRAKDAFLAALSHELRTPLSPVLLLATDAAENPGTPPELRDVFDTIRKNVELEARLIDDLLDLTRIARGKLALDLRSNDARSMLHYAISILRPDMEQKRLRLDLNLAAERHTVIGDDVRLQQVFWNVLKNAVKFTPEGGAIRVETSIRDGVCLVISVTDTGIGMTREELDRAFEAFSQGDHAAESPGGRFGGVGLGLAISRSLVELQKGRIHASSDGRGCGATFVIELPLAPEGVTGSGRPIDDGGPSQPAPTAPAGERVKVLLVEDHEPTRAAIRQLLTRRGYAVVCAGSVTEARAVAATDHFQLLISDIGLPDGTGYDLMESLRERDGLRGIALTGYGMEQDIARSQSAGFLVHLTKPVRVQTLEKALAQARAADALQKTAPSPPREAEMGGGGS